MPRRISDYPDGFTGWNLVSSLGSMISVVATVIFLNTLYQQLVNGKTLSRNDWSYPQHFTDYLQWLLSRNNESIEWALNSPPKPHPFISLPMQGSITLLPNLKEKLLRLFTFKNIIKLMVIGLIGFILKLLILYKLNLNIFIEWYHPVSLTYAVSMPIISNIVSILVDYFADLIEFFRPKTLISGGVDIKGNSEVSSIISKMVDNKGNGPSNNGGQSGGAGPSNTGGQPGGAGPSNPGGQSGGAGPSNPGGQPGGAGPNPGGPVNQFSTNPFLTGYAADINNNVIVPMLNLLDSLNKHPAQWTNLDRGNVNRVRLLGLIDDEDLHNRAVIGRVASQFVNELEHEQRGRYSGLANTHKIIIAALT